MKGNWIALVILLCFLQLTGCAAPQEETYVQLDNSAFIAEGGLPAESVPEQADAVREDGQPAEQPATEQEVAAETEETAATEETEETGLVIEEIDGCTYADGVLIVNKSYMVPQSYGSGITAETQQAFDTMQSAAAREGLTLFICSGFRSYDYQATLYNNYVARDGQTAADTYSARPGHSEHQTGLALDINSTDGSMATSAEGLWLAEHCAEYGFVIRYPQGKEHITGYMYEPWHVRYLGTELAAELTEKELTLEEYFGLTSEYPEG